MLLLLLYWSIMIFCYAAASKLRAHAASFSFIDRALNIVIYLLVCVMGLRMGANEEVTSNLGTIGLQSVLITLLTVGGSMLAVFVTRKIVGIDRHALPVVREKSCVTTAEKEVAAVSEIAEELESAAENAVSAVEAFEEAKTAEVETVEAEHGSGAKTTLLILTFVIIGMLGGYYVVPRFFSDLQVFQDMSGSWLTAGICILLGLVGFNMGLSGTVVENLKTIGFRVLFFPFAAVAGSLLAGVLYGLLSPLTVGEAVAVSAGFGWYTLAPSMITEAGHAVAGAISFMHNVIRETLGIIIIPLTAQKIGYIEATAIPGVSAMDVCMPIVERSCNQETLVYSFCTGALMCIVVPLLVPLVIG